MGPIINAVLIAMGTFNIICGVSYAFREKQLGINSIIVMIMGIFAGSWNISYGLMGSFSASATAAVFRILGVCSVCIYLSVLVFFVVNRAELKTISKRIITICYFLYALSDAWIFSHDKGHTFVRINERTAYYVKSSPESRFHYLYVFLTFLLLFIVAIIWLNRNSNKVSQRFLLVIVASHFFLIFSTIPDTILPILGYASFPSSCFGITIAYSLIWYGCCFKNVLGVTKGSLSNSIFTKSNENILVFNADYVLCAANSSSINFFRLYSIGYQKLYDLFDIEKKESDSIMENIFNDGISEINLHKKDSDISCTLRFTPIGQKNNISAVMVFVYDRTKEEKLIENIRKTSKAKSDFLSNMSHEIRTPLNAVIGMNEMILRETNDNSIAEYATAVDDSARMLLSLINDILDISRIESGKVNIISDSYDTISLLSDCCSIISERAERKGLTFSIQCDESLPSSLNGDMTHIRQIVVNLLSNAVKYTEKGKITLSVSSNNSQSEKNETITDLIISVADTGIGIKPENLDRLFDKFERVDLEHNRSIEGTGLGLNICHNLAAMMGGRITVKSTYGEGSVFTLIIPQKITDATPVGYFDPLISEKKIRHSDYSCSFTAPDARILVVDDVEVNRKVIINLLKNTKISIDTAESGDECIRLVCEKKYDIIFMDHMMPKMDGIETYSKMKTLADNKNPDTPVIMLTANAINGMDKIYSDNGFADYLTKPVNAESLENTLKKFITQNKAESENISEDISVAEISKTSAIHGCNMDAGIRNCGGSEEFYYEVLGDYISENSASVLENLYFRQSWHDYAVAVHSHKTTSRTLGFEEIAGYAEKLQYAAENKDTDRIDSLHRIMIEKTHKAYDSIRMLLDEKSD